MKIPAGHERGGSVKASHFLRGEKVEKEPNPLEEIRARVDQHWEEVMKEYRDFRPTLTLEVADHVQMASALLVLFPERRAQLELDDTLWAASKRTILKEHPGWLHRMSTMARVFPEHRSELEIDEQQDCIDTIPLLQRLQLTPDLYMGPEIHDFLNGLGAWVDYLILFPHKRDQLPISVLEKKILQHPEGLKDIVSVFSLADLRVLFPEGEIRKRVYSMMKEHAWYRGDNEQNFSLGLSFAIQSYAAVATVLADEVVVNEKGVHLRMHVTPEPAAPLPERSIV